MATSIQLESTVVSCCCFETFSSSEMYLKVPIIKRRKLHLVTPTHMKRQLYARQTHQRTMSIAEAQTSHDNYMVPNNPINLSSMASVINQPANQRRLGDLVNQTAPQQQTLPIQSQSSESQSSVSIAISQPLALQQHTIQMNQQQSPSRLMIPFIFPRSSLPRSSFHSEIDSQSQPSSEQMQAPIQFPGIFILNSLRRSNQSNQSGISQLYFQCKQPVDLTDTCCVCQQDIQSGQDICKTMCLHSYHKDCIRDWLKVKASCPLCKIDLRQI